MQRKTPLDPGAGTPDPETHLQHRQTPPDPEAEIIPDPEADTPIPRGNHPLGRDSHQSRWYTSYWNAFLLLEILFAIINPYSAIQKAAVRPAAVQNDLWRSFLPAAPIDSQWTIFCSTGIIPGKPVERPGTVRPAAL